MALSPSSQYRLSSRVREGSLLSLWLDPYQGRVIMDLVDLVGKASELYMDSWNICADTAMQPISELKKKYRHVKSRYPQGKNKHLTFMLQVREKGIQKRFYSSREVSVNFQLFCDWSVNKVWIIFLPLHTCLRVPGLLFWLIHNKLRSICSMKLIGFFCWNILFHMRNHA